MCYINVSIEVYKNIWPFSIYNITLNAIAHTFGLFIFVLFF